MQPPRLTVLGLAATILFCAGGVSAQTPAAPAKPPAKPSAKRDVEPKVLSAEESAKRARGSSFLGGGEADRYGDLVPFSELPPWKQASFYGVRARAQTVVFVVDCSESMADDSCLIRAKRELRRSVASLQFPQKFTVIFYNEEPIPMPGLVPRSVDTGTKDQFLHWLRLIEPDGGTDPRGAMQLAIGMNPDAIYLLSDGLFPNGTSETIADRNRKKIPIHCIDLSGGEGGEHLRRIAKDSGGQYAARSR